MTKILSASAFSILSLIALWGVPSPAQAVDPPRPPDLVLEGNVNGAQNQTYVEVPFRVPEHVHRLSVDFRYTTHEEHTVLDLSIADPQRFRGSSGGNKDHFTISETDATPSYLPGPIQAGIWKLLISVPNIRSQIVASYHAEIRFNSPLEESSFALAPLDQERRWYRGDLHMHTAHSDGSCPSQSGKRVPCPVFVTVQAAATRGLDFIAITDHNSESQYEAMRELQPYFDRVLLIPGREITTFYGHLNVFGTTQFIDFRVQPHGGRDLDGVLADALSQHAIASINHAMAPTGEVCMGCGWTPVKDPDMGRFAAVEVINGASLQSSIGFWEKQLRAGFRLTAVAGSDNHNASIPLDHGGSVGSPSTVVRARELSVAGILEGIKAGHAFVDVTASRNRLLEFNAHTKAATAEMGDTLTAAAREEVVLALHVAGCEGSTLRLLLDGTAASELPDQPVNTPEQAVEARWPSDGARHWIRAEVRDSSGKLMLLSNPVYLNYPPR